MTKEKETEEAGHSSISEGDSPTLPSHIGELKQQNPLYGGLHSTGVPSRNGVPRVTNLQALILQQENFPLIELKEE
ncbi:MAG: hypothetical protein ACTSYT_04625 [Candidatus Asgardarchaeia archaeon]